ncbi:MAG: hypothetical protein M5U31_16360, partial [Acidimicrobiia bacterium]|nr:hypothetical protein [Acidimicrobiia bacterium]
LQAVADGRATKIFLPTEMQGLFGTVGGLAQLLNGDDSGDSDDDAPEHPPAPAWPCLPAAGRVPEDAW